MGNTDSRRKRPASRSARNRVSRLLRTRLRKGVAAIVAVAIPVAVGWLVTWGLDTARYRVGKLQGPGQMQRPVAVNVQSNRDNIAVGGTVEGGDYVIPRPIQEVPAPPWSSRLCYGRHEWAHALGGVDTDNRVRVTLQGRSAAQVLISNFRVKAVRRVAPIGGSTITCPRGGPTAGVPIRELSVDLDQAPPTWSYRDQTRAPSSGTFAFTVSGGQTEVFDISASSESHLVEWIAEFTLVVDGKQETVTVDDNGKPFVTTATKNAKSWTWSPARSKWIKFDHDLPADEVIGKALRPPRVPPCSLLSRIEVKTALVSMAKALRARAVVGAPSGFNERIQGLEVAVDGAGCNYPTTVEFANGATGYIDGAGTRLQTADDVRQAQLEYESNERRARANGPIRQLAGFGDEAFVTDQYMFARNGSELLWVGVDKAFDPNQGFVEQLGRRAATRAWP
jgi:hypothetical protein